MLRSTYEDVRLEACVVDALNFFSSGRNVDVAALSAAWRFLELRAYDDVLYVFLNAYFGRVDVSPPQERVRPDGSRACDAIYTIAAAACTLAAARLREWSERRPPGFALGRVGKKAANACVLAAYGGDLEALRRYLERTPPLAWGEEVCAAAAIGGHIDVLGWLRAQAPPCPWDGSVCATAACNGDVATLAWLRAQEPPCPWGVEVCAAAAIGGHIDILKWLRAQTHPCPWNESVCAAAVKGGNLVALVWLRACEPPCPWNRTECHKLARSPELREWIDGQAN